MTDKSKTPYVKRTKILFMMQVPPPVTGASLRNSAIFNYLNSHLDYQTKLIPFNFAKKVSSLSSFSVKKLLRSFSISLKMVFDLVFFRPRIIYMTPAPTGFAYYRDIINILLAKLSRKKIIFHLRPLGFRSQSEKSKIFSMINKFLFRNVYVICLSEATAEDIEGIYSGRPLILSNGIEVVEFREVNRKNNTPVILFFSNIFFAKGITEFLESLSILKNKGVEFRGRIYGQEGDVSANDLNGLIKRSGLADNVDYLGEISGNEKYRIYFDSDIFVFPTHKENFPGVILEAMQSSLPVISVFEGSIPEIVVDGETGFLKNKNDQKGMAERIKFLIDNPDLRKEMGRKGRERFLKLYTMEIFKKNILKILKYVTESKKP